MFIIQFLCIITAGINLNGLNSDVELMAGLNINGNDDWNYHETQISNDLPSRLTNDTEAQANIKSVEDYYEHPGFLIFKNNYANAISVRGSNITFINPAWNEYSKNQGFLPAKYSSWFIFTHNLPSFFNKDVGSYISFWQSAHSNSTNTLGQYNHRLPAQFVCDNKFDKSNPPSNSNIPKSIFR